MRKKLAISLLALCLCAQCVSGQLLSQSDSIQFSKLHFTRNKFINNIFQQAVNSIRRTPGPDGYLNGKSEDPYMPYQGKIIRHINIETFGFNRSFTDTSARDNSLGSRVASRFHRTTRKFVVRDNLFIRENTPLNAYKVADNERFMRSLEYIRDVRIVVDTIAGNPDSVDLTVYTKDLFSIAGGAASQGISRINGNLYDANLAGMGQKLEITGLYDEHRDPKVGYGASYKKNNIRNTFIDATVGYSLMNFYAYTHQEESTHFITLSRQLVSPYTRFAGAVTVSHNENYNLYHLPDSVVFRYKYDLFDAWAGYNIGLKVLTATNNFIRDRRFLAFRYINRHFNDVPTQVGNNFDPLYNTTKMVLGQFTFFRQDYYKTQYVYGFGTTEDLPYGYNISVTGGWQKQLTLERPYAGFNISDYIATNKGDFIQVYLRAGGFMHEGRLQDASVLGGLTAYSRLFFWNSTKIRQYINANFTYLHNRITYAPLRIDNYYGLRGFLSDSVYGSRRASIQLETEFYLKYRVLGFQFAPFPYGDITMVVPQNRGYGDARYYTSLGGGIRGRNENLVFETIEARAYYFPVAPPTMRGFKIIINTNIRFRYSSSYVTAPDVVQLNQQ